MFSINEFKSSIDQKGVLQNNRFVASFAVPKYLEDAYGAEDTRLISLRCESANLPGLQLSLIERPRIGFGPLEYNPYNIINDDINLTFITDAHGSISKFFYDWMNTIVNFQGSKGQSELNKATSVRGHNLGAFEVGYKDNFTTKLVITVYDKNGSIIEEGQPGNKVMELTAYKAFPKQLPTIDLSWQNESELIRMTVPFAFTDYTVEYFMHENSFEATVNVPGERAKYYSGYTRPKKVNEIPESRKQEIIDNANRTISDPNASSFEKAGAREVRRTVATPLAGPKI